MDANPFPDLKIDSSEFLDEVSGRSICPKCKRSRKYYCYTCYVPVEGISKPVPRIKLPLKIDVIKHPSEVDGKSTAAHAGVISPDDVTIYTYPCIPEYDKNKVVLVFPGETSVSLEELAKQYCLTSENKRDSKKRKFSEFDLGDQTNSDHATALDTLHKTDTESETESQSILELKKNGVENVNKSTDTKNENADKSESQSKDSCDGCADSDLSQTTESDDILKGTDGGGVRLSRGSNSGPIEKVVFIDSTWNQTKTICRDERLKGLRCVELKTRNTQFWRHQKDIPNTYLSTIEAIYYFLRDYHENFIQSKYTGEYDNLLFFFVFMYRKIRNLYDGGNTLRAYKERKEKMKNK